MGHEDAARQLNEFKDLALVSITRNSAGENEWQDIEVVEMWSFPRNCPWLEAVGEEELFGSLEFKLRRSPDEPMFGGPGS